MRILTVVLLIFITIGVSAHPLHMSVSNVNIKDNKIEIEFKAFAKDLAHELNAINHLDYGADYYLLNPLNDSLLLKHFKANFSVEYNDGVLVLTNLAVELIQDNFVIKASAIVINACQSCKIKNSLLLKTNHDQKNLVIVNCEGIEKGIELTVDNPEETLTF